MIRVERKATILRSAGLVLALFLLLPSQHLQAQESERDPRARPRRETSGLQRGARAPALQKPKDPSRVRATYRMGGKEHQVTEGEFYETWLMIKGQEEQPNFTITPNRVVEHILSFAEARMMGCELTPAEIDLINPLESTDNPILAQGLKDRLKSQGISEEQYVRYLAETRAIQRLRNLFANSGRVLSQDVYDSWKQQHQNYVVSYIEFSAAEEEAELRKNPPDENTLREFFARNASVQNQLRRPTTVTADLVVMDAKKIDPSKIPGADREISYEEALHYFRKNIKRLMSQIPSDKRQLLYPRKETPLEDLVTPFQVLRPQIEKELLLKPLIDKVFEEARRDGPKWNAEAAAKTYGLEYHFIENLGRNEVYKRFRDFGPQLFNKLWNTPNGQVCDEIQSDGNRYYFWRLRSKNISTLPTFEEAMKLGLLEKYYEIQGFNRASEKAQQAMKEINSAVDESVADEMAKIDKRYDDLINKAIREQNLKDPNKINLEKVRMNARRNAEKNKIRHRLRPKFFDEYVAKHGLELKTYGPFEFRPGMQSRKDITDPEELKHSFVASYWGFRSLDPGEVVGQVASDRLSNTHFIFKLVDKRLPDFEDMPPVDYLRIRSNLVRSQVYNANFRWTYNQLVSRYDWIEK